MEDKLFTLKSLSSHTPALLSSIISWIASVQMNLAMTLILPSLEGGENIVAPTHPPSPNGEGVVCHSEPTGERIQLMIADGGQEGKRI